MKYQERALRLTAALAIAGLVASQIPMRGQTAMGSVKPPGNVQPADGYLSGNSDNSGSFLGIKGLTNRNAITGVALGLLGLGAYSTILDSRSVATAAASAGAAGGLKGVLIAGANNKPIYDVLKSMPEDFSETVKLVDSAEQVNLLREDHPYTFFAPTNSGLSLLSVAQLAQLKDPSNKSALVELIKRHTISGRYKITELLALKDGTTLEALSGDKIVIRNKNGILTVNNILVSQNDIAASNGWIHPIEATLDSNK
jgi:uncharacterized surface protein with fasciclin (FAS1) repeats